MIEVAIQGSELQDGPLLLEDSDNLDSVGLEIQRSLFMLNEKGEATVTVLGFSERIPKGAVVGTAVEVSPVCHLDMIMGMKIFQVLQKSDRWVVMRIWM